MTQPELRVSFQIQAELSEISQLRSRLSGFLEATSIDLDARACMEVTLALDEAATNIVLHAYGGKGGAIDVEYENAGSELVIRLWDSGVQREAEDCVGLPPGSVGVGGMGTNIMRAIMSSVSYEQSEDGRNLLIMRRSTNHRSWTGDDDDE